MDFLIIYVHCTWYRYNMYVKHTEWNSRKRISWKLKFYSVKKKKERNKSFFS